jgi:hypothetical protein
MYVYRRVLYESKSAQGFENWIKHGEITVSLVFLELWFANTSGLRSIKINITYC